MTTKRPSSKDTEEDLLRFQDEYLKSIGKKQDTSKAAAAVYKNPKLGNGEKSGTGGEEEEEEDHGDPAWFPEKLPSILGEIVERPFDSSKVKFPSTSVVAGLNSSGFPEPEVLNLEKLEETRKTGRGLSLFARQMLAKQQQKKAASKEMTVEDEDQDEMAEEGGGEGTMREISSKLMAEIDAENSQKLAKMATEEIESERVELRQNLPPNLIEFLKNRNKTKSTLVSENKQKKPEPKPEAAPLKKQPEIEQSELPIKPDPKWLHMNTVESEKLEWTKDIPIAASAISELKAFETRFDFAGEIAPIPAVVLNTESSEDGIPPPPVELPPTASGLYHHGNEPDRPGYTLAELLELARSSAVQQRVLALRTLSAICHQARRGRYFAAGLDKPVIPCLIEAGFAFTIRQALDDSSSEGNALASLTALQDLLIEENDEELLESWTSSNTNSKFPYFCDKIVTAPLSDEGLKKVDDANLMSRDVTLCLVFRTNLIARLRYILCDWPIGVGSEKIRRLVIAILLRIARHSPACASQIASGSSGQRLMAKLCSTDDELVKDEKCLELLATIAQSVPSAVSTHFNPNRLHEFVAPNHKSPESSFRLAGNAVHLLSSFCQGNFQSAKNLTLALGQRFVEIETILLSKAAAGSTCDLGDEILRYFSSVFQLFSSLSNQKNDQDEELYNFDALIYGLLEPIFVLFPDKFITWLNETPIKKHLLLLLASAYHLAASSPGSIERMVISEKFLKLTELALSKSVSGSVAHSSCSVVLLSFGTDLKQNNESPRALQYLNALTSSCNFDENSNKSVQNWSLVTAIFQFFASIPHQESLLGLIKRSILLPDIVTYFKLIANKRSPVGFANCFFNLNFELSFVCAYLGAFTSIVEDFDEIVLKTLYTSILKLLPLMPGLFSSNIWRVFFDGFIFSPKILQHFDKTLAGSIQSVRSVYRDALTVLLEGQKFCPFSQSALCKDWLYFPLAAAGITITLTPADQSTSSGGGEAGDIMPAMRHRVVVSVLRFARFSLRLLPQTVLQELTPLTHFVRLSSLYLNDDVFGGAAGELEGVRGLLAECLTALLKSSASSLNFSERVPGLDCTLPDFYIALLEQFKATSYGDVVFGNILLLFVGAVQPVAFRRLLWGDHREVLTILRNVQPEQLLIEIDSLLQPFESDLHVIKLYAEFVFNEIVPQFRQTSLNNHSVLWIVAVNHLNAFLFDSSDHKIGKMLRKSIWQAVAQQIIDASETKKLKLKDLVFYKYCTPSSVPASQVPQLYETLPQNRQVFLRSILGEETCRSFMLSLMQR